MINKYIKAFREACEKLDEQDFSHIDWENIPPESFNDSEIKAQEEFDRALKQLQNGLITRKEFIAKVSHLYNSLPDFDWTRDKNAKLPNTLFPEAYNKLKEKKIIWKRIR